MTEQEFNIKAKYIFNIMRNNQIRDDYWNYFFLFISRGARDLWKDINKYMEEHEKTNNNIDSTSIS